MGDAHALDRHTCPEPQHTEESAPQRTPVAHVGKQAPPMHSFPAVQHMTGVPQSVPPAQLRPVSRCMPVSSPFPVSVVMDPSVTAPSESDPPSRGRVGPESLLHAATRQGRAKSSARSVCFIVVPFVSTRGLYQPRTAKCPAGDSVPRPQPNSTLYTQ